MYRLIYRVKGETHEKKDENPKILWDKIIELQNGKGSCPLSVQWYLYNKGGVLIHSSLDAEKTGVVLASVGES